MLLEQHHYQEEATSFLLDNPYSGLFLDPGLGKTSITLMYILMAKKYLGMKKFLIIAPKRVCQMTWPDEIRKWSQFTNLTFVDLRGESKNRMLKEDYDIYLINRENLMWFANRTEYCTLIDFDVLIIDESSKFKNWSAKYTRCLVKMLKRFKRRHILTGTPAPNGYMDLFSQIFILDLGKALGNKYTFFKTDYFNYNPFTFKHTLKKDADITIQNKIQHLILSMGEKEYLSLPEKVDNIINVELDGQALGIYISFEKLLFAEIEKEEVVLYTSGAAYNACRQVASGHLYKKHNKSLVAIKDKIDRENREFYFIHCEKLDALAELIDSLDGQPLLVAYNFNHELEELKRRWPEASCIARGQKETKQMQTIKEWNEGKIKILFAQPASMAHGLNMQKVAQHVCWFSLTDNLEDYVQFNKRVHRQGVSGRVIVHHIIAKGTVDEVIFARNTKKYGVQESLLDSLKRYKAEKETKV